MPEVENQDIELSHKDFLYDYLPSNFPKDFEELSRIPQIQKIIKEDQDLMTDLRIDLAQIVFKHRKRFIDDPDYFVRIEQCVRAAESAERALKQVVDLFVGMDNEHRECALEAAREIAPLVFPEQKLGDFLEQLTVAAMKMEVLAPAVSAVTGVAAEKRGKGRPVSNYIVPAYELMQEWESITAEAMTVGEAIIGFSNDDITPTKRRALRRIKAPSDSRRIKHVPTPRPLAKGKDREPKPQYAEHSTAFIGLCLKMIAPKITPQEVVTAIKHAVTLRPVYRRMVANVHAGKSRMVALTEAIKDKK
jgi:hypothetical protein